jgi:hypothetical protein
MRFLSNCSFQSVFFQLAYWGVESKLGPIGMSAIYWTIVPTPGDYDDGEFGGMKIGRGNRSTRRKTCPSATLSTTNPTSPDPFQSG